MAKTQMKEIQELREKEKKRTSKTQTNSPVADPYELNLPQTPNNKLLKQPLKPVNLKIITKDEVTQESNKPMQKLNTSRSTNKETNLKIAQPDQKKIEKTKSIMPPSRSRDQTLTH